MIDHRHAGMDVSTMASNGSGTQFGVNRERLLDLIARHAYRYHPDKPFQLSSGKESAEYIDCKSALTFPEAMVAMASVLYPQILPSVEAVGGLTMGADPIAHSLCQYSFGQPRQLRWFTVRKDAKEHGLKRDVEGGVPPMSRIAIVDDVVTEGGSTLDAVSKCLLVPYTIDQIIILLDRQQGGLERIRSEVSPRGVQVSAIFTKDEIHARWETQQAT